MSISVLASELMRLYKVEPYLMRLYRATAKALKLLGVDHKSFYAKLSRYMAAITRTNASSMVDL